MKALMISSLLFLIVSCSSPQYIEVVRADEFLSLVQDSDGLYFKSKGSGDCPLNNIYNGSALSPINHDLSESREYRSLSSLINLPSFKFIGSTYNQYIFQDINYRYTVLTHLCDNTVGFEDIH